MMGVMALSGSMEFAKRMVEIFSGVGWLMWSAVALFVVTTAIAVGFCISTIKHHCRIAGLVMLFDTFAQTFIAIYQFSVDGGGWFDFFFGILFAFISLICGLMMVAVTE